MKIILNIVKYLFVIILSICILGIIILKVLSSSLLDESYVLRKMEESNYYEKIYNQVESNFEKYILQSGLEEDVIKGIITQEQVKEDTEAIIDNIYRGTKTEIGEEELRKKLDENIRNSLGDRKLSATEELSIEKFEDTICNEYKKTVVSTEYNEKINKILEQTKNVYETVKIGLYSFTVVIAILLIVLNIGNITRAISNFGISFAVSGIFYLVINILINNKIKIANIKILNTSISEVIQNVILGILEQIVTISISCVIIGLVLILLGNILNGHKNKIEGN